MHFFNKNVWFPTKISLKFVPKVLINNIQALVLIMAWRRADDKPLSEPMMVSLPTHICVTRPQWINLLFDISLHNQIITCPSITWCHIQHCGDKGRVWISHNSQKTPFSSPWWASYAVSVLSILEKTEMHRTVVWSYAVSILTILDREIAERVIMAPHCSSLMPPLH